MSRAEKIGLIVGVTCFFGCTYVGGAAIFWKRYFLTNHPGWEFLLIMLGYVLFVAGVSTYLGMGIARQAWRTVALAGLTVLALLVGLALWYY